MPKAGAKVAPFLAICCFVGAAVYLYPDVNRRIWNMLQARRGLVKQDGNPAAPQDGLRAPLSFPTGSSENRGQTPSGGLSDDAAGSRPAWVGEVAWDALDVAPPVAENSSFGEAPEPTGRVGSSLSPQVILAIPAERAPEGPRNRPPNAQLPDSHSCGRFASGTGSGEGDGVPKAGPPGKPAETSENGGGGAARMSQARADGGNSDEAPLPPLVPIRRTSAVSPPPEHVNSVSGYQALPVQEGIARQMREKPVGEAVDPPLVTIIKNRWFTQERPERLPPVTRSTPGPPDQPAPSYWTPEWPLYPSTGR